ncbi:MAG TPA: hypothetical protein VKV26_06710 [Dehalococcoidia bacterium]|nr:hypothetical protein [Dehalococcoidia bacterium]
MRKWTVVGMLAAAIGLMAIAVPHARADGSPAGEGANACYQLYAGGQLAGATPLVVNAKYNVGNPASVLVAGDCSGGAISFVDDGLTVTLSNPTGGGGSLHQNFFNFCGGSNNGGPALDVTALFKPGTNSFSLTLTNECGGTVFAPALFLVVRQH